MWTYFWGYVWVHIFLLKSVKIIKDIIFGIILAMKLCFNFFVLQLSSTCRYCSLANALFHAVGQETICFPWNHSSLLLSLFHRQEDWYGAHFALLLTGWGKPGVRNYNDYGTLRSSGPILEQWFLLHEFRAKRNCRWIIGVDETIPTQILLYIFFPVRGLALLQLELPLGLYLHGLWDILSPWQVPCAC